MMQLPVVFFLVTTFSVLTGAVTMKTLIFPKATNDSYVELVRLKPLALDAFTLCMRVATELKGEREVILFAYRTRENVNDELKVWRKFDGRLSLFLSGDGVAFDLPQLEALETHLCITWDSSSGLATMYHNGRKSLSKPCRQGHYVRSGGKVILGQDPDTYDGEFDQSQSFVGEISDVNMWDTVLPYSTIQELYSGKRVQPGNIFDWRAIELESYGAVHVATREL